jgi:uncharacterized protein involved in exopolysaccharide biosynthesis
VDNEFALKDILNILFKRKWTLLLIFFSFTVAMLVGNSLTLLEYEARATLLIQKTRGDVLLSPLDSRSFNVQMAPQQDLNSEADLVKSRLLLEAVANERSSELLGDTGARKPQHADLAFGPLVEAASFVKAALSPPNQLKLSPVEQIISDLSQDIRVTTVPASNIMQVYYKNTDPQVAADVVNSLVQRYLDFTVLLRRKADAYKIFDEQSQKASERLLQLRQALHAYDENAGIVAPQTQEEVSFARLAEMDNSLKFVRADLALARAQARALEAQLKSTPRRVETTKEMRWNAVKDELKKKLSELQIERQQLLSRFTEKHRSVIENDKQIEVVTGLLNSESGEVLGAARSDVNPTAQSLAKELADTRATIAGFQAKEQTLMAEVGNSRQRLAQFHSLSIARDQMLREIQVAEETHIFYRRKSEEARIDSALDDSKITNVKVAEWAKPPLGPAGLNRRLFLFLGAGVAMVAGLGVAFGRELMDRSVGTPEEAERRLDLPVLASIPETKDK